MRGATLRHGFMTMVIRVSIHAPHAGRDINQRQPQTRQGGFNPRAPCGARPHARQRRNVAAMFQSTRPMRGATRLELQGFTGSKFQSTRPMRGATSRATRNFRVRPCFNPRAPCGARPPRCVLDDVAAQVSIHAPHAGRDLFSCQSERSAKMFQSTRPMRGATRTIRRIASAGRFQSTRPMRGATYSRRCDTYQDRVSIHAPHAGRDKRLDAEAKAEKGFQSTRPMRGATKHKYHSARSKSFNPRAPCGARRTPIFFFAGR